MGTFGNISGWDWDSLIDGCGRRNNGRLAMVKVAATVEYLRKGKEKKASPQVQDC